MLWIVEGERHPLRLFVRHHSAAVMLRHDEGVPAPKDDIHLARVEAPE
jgi:hypothetical protein